MEINHIDCFSGPGGICTGFHAAGINTIVAIEKVKSCVQTYSANHPNVKVIHKDIRKVTAKELKEAVGDKKIHIVTSGMPCETFSTAGATSRSSYDHRQQLYYEGIRIARIVNSPLVLFENVPGILSKKVEKGGDRLIVDDIIQDLYDNGYKYSLKITLKAVEFGVPQTRERFFILASKYKKYKLEAPLATFQNVCVGDAFVGLPEIETNSPKEDYEYTGDESEYTSLLKDFSFWNTEERKIALTYQKSPKHRDATIKRFQLIKGGESLVDAFRKHSEEEVKRLQKEKILPKKWYIQRNKRLINEEPSKTVTSHCLDELVHPIANRALTVREVARLQSFPDFYKFEGPYIVPHLSEIQDKYEQIGDAVPPLLAYHWGKKIKNILEAK